MVPVTTWWSWRPMDRRRYRQYSTPGYLLNGAYAGPRSAPGALDPQFMRLFPFLCRAVRLDISIAAAPTGFSSPYNLPRIDERRPSAPNGQFHQSLCDERSGVTVQGPDGTAIPWIPERIYVARVSASWFNGGNSRVFEPVATYCFSPNLYLGKQFDTNPPSRPPTVFTVCSSPRELGVVIATFSNTSRCVDGTGEARVRIRDVQTRMTRVSEDEPVLRPISQCVEILQSSGRP